MRRIAPPLIFGVVGVAILLALGFWQLGRQTWKDAMLAEITAGIAAAPVTLPVSIDPSMKYLPVLVSGRTTGDEILILSGTRDLGGGYQVVSGFETADGRRIMVDRGFIPQDDRHVARPPVALTLRGNLHWPSEKTSSTPKPNLTEGIWFARDVPAMAAKLGTEPVLVVAAAVEGDAQGIDPLPVAVTGIPNNHAEYAVTWFMLAAVWAGMTAYLISRIRRGTH